MRVDSIERVKMQIKKLFNIDFFLNLNLMVKPSNIVPDFQIRDLTELTSILLNLNVSGLIFDIDQTIVPFRETKVSTEFTLLLKNLNANYQCCLLSNFVPSDKRIQRIKSIEEQIKIKAIHGDRKKPAPEVFQQALALLDLPPEETVMIGDRIFTDIIGANHLGIYTVLVKPLKIKTDPIIFVTIPRFFENIYLKLVKFFIS